MSDHTPGPWTVTHDGQGRPYAWIDGGDGFDAVARVVHAQDDLSGYIPDADRIDDPRALANARLIAAAPDLLAACEAAFPKLHGVLSDRGAWPHQIGYECDGYQVYEQVRRALAKAGSEVTP